MPIPEELRKLAAASKLSQRELARVSGIHHVTLSRFISGKQQIASVASVEKLAKALGYTLKLVRKPR